MHPSGTECTRQGGADEPAVKNRPSRYEKVRILHSHSVPNRPETNPNKTKDTP
jgi:hypothetical protein